MESFYLYDYLIKEINFFFIIMFLCNFGCECYFISFE